MTEWFQCPLCFTGFARKEGRPELCDSCQDAREIERLETEATALRTEVSRLKDERDALLVELEKSRHNERVTEQALGDTHTASLSSYRWASAWKRLAKRHGRDANNLEKGYDLVCVIRDALQARCARLEEALRTISGMLSLQVDGSMAPRIARDALAALAGEEGVCRHGLRLDPPHCLSCTQAEGRKP